MPEEGLIVPKYKDKTTYYQSELGFESSYPVSASFRGILRLSPNDLASLLEDNTVEIFNDNVTTISYKDSIDNELESQFIRISTSDGYLLDCRLGRYGAEFDNLYVIGPAQHEKILLFADDNKSFRLGNNTYLPVNANQNSTAIIDSGENMDKDIIKNDTQNVAHVLVSHGSTERNFVYEGILDTIDNAILEALLDLSTEPVGSIHYFPISIKEYEKLLLKGRPNQFYQIEPDEKGEKIKNCPIIRDYLLCDGSLYKNIDFPELAKILDGEKIVYWDLDATKNKYVKKEYINDYTVNKNFRVPDLRRMFLRAAYPDITKAGEDGNKVGDWEVDHRPTCSQNAVQDNHTHCITSSFFSGSYKSTGFKDVVEEDKDGNLALTEEASVLAPANQVFWGGDRIESAIYRCSAQSRFFWYSSMGYASYSLSIPKEFNYQTRNISADVGLSSENITTALMNPSSDSEISYNELDEYVPYLTQTKETYGMENAPEFFCGLPLIKI